MSNSTIKPSEEAVDDGKNHYISTLEYIGSLKHLNLDLKCEVVHKGYKEEQLDQFENIVTAKFNIPKPSPVDCELGPWNECNVTCGTGMKSRFIVQKPLYGGKECPTDLTSECSSGPCPIDCQLSSWSDCDATCGTGMKSRIIVQEALYGGKECSTNRTIECNSEPCSTERPPPNNCQWSSWSECSTKCRPEKQTRETLVEAINGGECPGNKTRDCPLKEYPEDCQWSAWGECSATCGSGKQNRTILVEATNGGECPGNKTQDCNLSKCSIPCKWDQWSKCSTSCGPGKQTRVQFGGKKCTEIKTQHCNLKDCPPVQPSCKWGQWSNCNTTCGPGKQTRVQFGGKKCTKKITRDCNLKECHVVQPSMNPPVDCEWGQWSQYSASCGLVKQSRRIQKPPVNGGKLCRGSFIQISYLKPCPRINCKWSDWTPCSATCGQGIQTRHVEIFDQTGRCYGPKKINCNLGSCSGTRFKQTNYYLYLYQLFLDSFHCNTKFMMCCINRNMNCNRNYNFCIHKALGKYHEIK